jgi:class 3 adenylate cyclase
MHARFLTFRVDDTCLSSVQHSYMAATGLPNPQPDHAVRMVKFARDCNLKMRGLLEELEMSLGDDTTDLAMRVGMHSGGVTAGVLRGDKTRFQLFGDTVNTASRMESNGVKGKIHCSQTTADALISAGKTQWLTSRVDKITAKGKGEMQT